MSIKILTLIGLEARSKSCYFLGCFLKLFANCGRVSPETERNFCLSSTWQWSLLIDIAVGWCCIQKTKPITRCASASSKPACRDHPDFTVWVNGLWRNRPTVNWCSSFSHQFIIEWTSCYYAADQASNDWWLWNNWRQRCCRWT